MSLLESGEEHYVKVIIIYSKSEATLHNGACM